MVVEHRTAMVVLRMPDVSTISQALIYAVFQLSQLASYSTVPAELLAD